MHRKTKSTKRQFSKKLRQAIKNSSIYQMSVNLSRRYLWGSGICRSTLKKENLMDD